MVKRIVLLAACVTVLACAGCNQGGGGDSTEPPGALLAAEENGANPAETAAIEEGEEKNMNPIVTITMEDGGVITLELYPDKAPNTVANFVTLVKDGFYDGVGFHRIMSGFMIQGGDPTGTGRGGPGYYIKGEMAENGFAQNDIKHEAGVISMARADPYDSAGSQFFIMHKANAGLDNKYAAFGKVIEGFDVVDRIATQTPTTGREGSTPTVPVVMKSVTVDDKGVEYKVERLP